MSRRSALMEIKDGGLSDCVVSSGICGGKGPTIGLVESSTGSVDGTLHPTQL